MEPIGPNRHWDAPLIQRMVSYICTGQLPLISFCRGTPKAAPSILSPIDYKLFNLLKPADATHCNSVTYNTLKDIALAGSTCSKIRPKPFWIQIAMANEDFVSNQTIAPYSTCLDFGVVSHVVDVETGYIKAAFLLDSRVEVVWNTFIRILAEILTEYPILLHSNYIRDPNYHRHVESLELQKLA